MFEDVLNDLDLDVDCAMNVSEVLFKHDRLAEQLLSELDGKNKK